jgi:acylphosphatase|tara:strand:- start:158 stop:433 length:276 start_codon:yes stop_codon:yes gene_type:complete
MSKRLNLKIYGRVQGVFFRDSVRRRAKKLDLVGSAVNQKDGTVQVIAEGQEENLKQLIKWCYNGPILARVDKIDIDWQEATGQFDKFEIKY